jgi:hypothetical protein
VGGVLRKFRAPLERPLVAEEGASTQVELRREKEEKIVVLVRRQAVKIKKRNQIFRNAPDR